MKPVVDHWNYRVVRSRDGAHTEHSIREVYYDADNKILGIGEKPAEPLENDWLDLIDTLASQYRALTRPGVDLDTREEFPAPRWTRKT